MKKSLVLLVAIVATVAFAGTALAWDCYPEVAPAKVICKDQVLCKGAAKGAIKLCGPFAPTIAYQGSWLTVLKCPAAPKPAKVAKKVAKKVKK